MDKHRGSKMPYCSHTIHHKHLGGKASMDYYVLKLHLTQCLHTDKDDEINRLNNPAMAAPQLTHKRTSILDIANLIVLEDHK